MPISRSGRDAIFGQPGKVKTRKVDTPWGLTVVCHELIADRFLDACVDAAELWTPLRIDSYVIRPIRGTENDPNPKWSMHAYALAWDFFDRPYPQPVDVWGPTNAPPAAFRAVFARYGFRLGANFDGRRDFPHIEWAEGRPPTTGPKPVDLPPSLEDSMHHLSTGPDGALHLLVVGIDRSVYHATGDNYTRLLAGGLAPLGGSDVESVSGTWKGSEFVVSAKVGARLFLRHWNGTAWSAGWEPHPTAKLAG